MPASATWQKPGPPCSWSRAAAGLGAPSKLELQQIRRISRLSRQSSARDLPAQYHQLADQYSRTEAGSDGKLYRCLVLTFTAAKQCIHGLLELHLGVLTASCLWLHWCTEHPHAIPPHGYSTIESCSATQQWLNTSIMARSNLKSLQKRQLGALGLSCDADMPSHA